MLKLIRSIFKKKNKMNFAEKTLEELDTELKNSDFQWIKGEQTGIVEKYDGVIEEGNMRFVSFKGGGRMNVELLSEFMDLFPATPVDFGIPQPAPANSQSKKSADKKGSVNSIDYGNSVQVGVEESPIYKLLKKQKPNWVNVNISLKLNLPTKSLYNVLVTSFEDAETEIASYVTEGVEIEDIRNAIAESIKTSFYETKKTSSVKPVKKEEIEQDELSED
jgi:hypothetical protein